MANGSITTLRRALVGATLALCSLACAAESQLELYLKSVESLPGFDLSSAKNSFNPADCSPIEGIWQMSSDGSDGLFAIVRDRFSSNFRMIVVDSADRSIPSGRVMGAISPLGADGYYDARIYSGTRRGKLTSPRRFTLRLQGDGRIIIKPVTDKFVFRLGRLIPYMYRVSVKHVSDRDKNLDGAVRIWPVPLKPIDGPIHL